MVDAPEKIWATINGASTRLPDGARQLIGGWSQDSERPNAIEYTRSDLVAELAAENERMTKLLAGRDSFIVDQGLWGDFVASLPPAKQSLASTGAVKELEWSEYETDGWADRADAEAGSFGVFYNIDIQPDGYRVVFDHESVGAIGTFDTADEAKAAAQADYERRILSALEPHPRATNTVDVHETANVSDKPKGQQEPVATGQHVAYFDDGQFHWMSGVAPRNCELYTRPSEQAVTEAMVERMCRTPFIEGFTPTTDEWQRCETIQDQYDLMKRRIREGMAALKAAMEAGG